MKYKDRIILKARRSGGRALYLTWKTMIKATFKPPILLLPIIAKSLFLKENGYKDTWYSNALYDYACKYKINQAIYHNIINNINQNIINKLNNEQK